jgi:transposase
VFEYTKQDLRNAIVDVRNEVAVRAAATRYGVPRGTLRARLNGAQPQRTANNNQQQLTANQEEHLKQWILRQEALGYAPTNAQVGWSTHDYNG